MRHVPVLLGEVIESLQLKPGMNVIDGTLGDGGHSEKILEATAPNGKVLGIDADPESLLRAKQFLYAFGPRVIFVRDNSSRIKEIVAENAFAPVNGILLDLGWSSPQFEERGRGFSFLKDEPLNMRYPGDTDEPGAADILNTNTEEELEIIFREYGEESLSKEIAKAIVEIRKTKAIERTTDLVNCILDVYRKKLKSTKDIPWVGGLHPATKVFQALRIAVNHELEVVEKIIPEAAEVLAPGGRLAIITFHSLEDRIVKHSFKEMENKGFKLITKKPIVCGEKEYEENTRARSAKLRVIEKI
jgi:16S rRNA (cytosine1402-N4)-methyltransferase